MSLVLFLLITFTLLIISYNWFDKDIFSPSVLFSLSYLVSIIFAIIGIRDWNISIGVDTVILISLGLFSFIFGESFARGVLIRNKSYKKKKNSMDNRLYYIPSFFLVAIIIVSLIVTIFEYREITRIAGLNMVSWGNLIYNFKTNQGNTELGDSNFSTLVNLGLLFCKGISYIFIFLIVQNNLEIRKRKNNKVNLLYYIPVLLAITQSLLKGVRIQVISYLLAAIFMYYFYYQSITSWSFRLNSKAIRRSSLIGIGGATVFYFAKDLLGRQQDNISFLDYLSAYLGGSIALFDMYLHRIGGNVQAGIDTFSGIVSSAQKLGLFKDVVIMPGQEYRVTPNGFILGNVYGAVRSYYQDFGVIGIVICFFAISFFISVAYYQLKRSDSIKNNLFLLLYYSSIVYGIVFLTFYNFILSKLTFGSILEAIVMFITMKIILRKTKEYNV